MPNHKPKTCRIYGDHFTSSALQYGRTVHGMISPVVGPWMLFLAPFLMLTGCYCICTLSKLYFCRVNAVDGKGKTSGLYTVAG